MRVSIPGCVIVVALAALAGCNGGGGGRKAVEVVQYPKWEFKEYKRVGVVPMKFNDRKAREAAAAATTTLSSDLAGNGYFDVVPTAEMKDILKEQDLSRISDVADPTTEIPAGRIKRAQALVIPVITDYEAREDRERKRQPHMTLDAKNRPKVTYTNVTEYRSYARVAGTVSVVDTTTGKVLFSQNIGPIEREDTAVNNHAEQKPADLAMEAAQSLAKAFYKSIAPQRMRVKFEEKNLQIALAYFEGRYETTRTVPADIDEFLVVVNGLPQEAVGNQYEVRISPAAGRDYVFQREFTWSGPNGGRGQALPVKTTELSAAGERFIAKLFAPGNDAPVLTREFTIAPVRQE
jgi:hypothetical protein